MSEQKSKVQQIVEDLNKNLREKQNAACEKIKATLNAGAPPYTREDLNQCCGQQLSPTAMIDLDKPLTVPILTGNTTVRLLSKWVKLDDCQGALVSVQLNIGLGYPEGLYVLDTVTGLGTGVRTRAQLRFKNAPVVTEQSFFVNYYENNPNDHNATVLEWYDTRKDADENNIFLSRDCCAKLTFKKVDGVLSASATIVAQ